MTAVTSAYTNIAAIIDAPTQAAAAASSAAQAAASAASGMYSAVQDKSANYTILAADAGDLIRVTTTSGAVTITLPLIAGALVGDGFKIAVVKWTADANAVNIARSGSDTINGATSAQIGSQYSQIIFVADGETNTWFASQSGLGATNVNIDNFSGNGSTTAFTLTSDPSTENNTAVYISGVYQQKNTYSVSGTTLTFSTAPPTGTTNIEVAYATPLAIGTPSDGTVTTAKIVDANVTAAKLASGAAVSNIGTGGITATELASNAVTTAKILDANVTLAKLSATGTKNATTYLRGDDTFATLSQKLLQTVIVYSSNTRVAFSGEANVSLTNANDFRYTTSARIGGSITKQSASSYCLVWTQYAAWVSPSNWHDLYIWEDTTNDARHIGFDVFRMSGPVNNNRFGHTFTQIFSGLGTGTRTFYIAPGSGDSRSNTGVLNYNPETDTGNSDCANQSTYSQMIVMEIEP